MDFKKEKILLLSRREKGTAKLEKILSEGNILFDTVSEETLLHGELKDSVLMLPNGKAYGAIVIAPCRTLSASLYDRLAALSEKGLPTIFVGSEPTVRDGYESETVFPVFMVTSLPDVADFLKMMLS